MKSKLFLTVLVVFMLVGTMVGGAGVVLAETECDPAVVSQAGNVITVKPTGVEDTVNIQCAFDLAVATGPGVEVTLTEGTFYTAQIVVNDFHGDFSGAGVEKTLIYNMQDMYVTPVDYYLDLPSSNNPWPALFAFISGDFVISDLAIYIIGEKITTPYSMFGWEPTTLLALGVVILGSDANARIERILLEGNAVENSLLPYNLSNGIFVEGWFGEPPWPSISGSFQVFDSTFKMMGYATPAFNTSAATIRVSHNKYEDTIIAMDISDTRNTNLEFSHNNVVNTWIGFDVWNASAPEHIGSTFLIKNNQIQSEIGIAFEQTFGEGNECLLLGNNVQKVADMGIYLGPGTYGCTVVGGNNKINILDLGTDNVLVGVNIIGTGVGPTIQHFMKP